MRVIKVDTKQQDLWQMGSIYFAVAVVGGLSAELDVGGLIARAAFADVVMTVAIFGVSLWRSNSSAYDAYWSVIPCFLTVWLLVKTDGAHWGVWQWTTFVMVNIWSWRLTGNWARGWSGWHHEDWRYIDLRAKHGPRYPLVNFFGIHFFPTVLVFLGCLALFPIASSQEFSAVWMCLGLGVGGLGIVIESIADNQLAQFRRRANAQSTDLLNTGLWAQVRYPNYLGEMLFWFGLGLCGLGAGGPWWVLLGPIAMVVLFVFISIPLKDERMQARRHGFDNYCEQVPALIPMPWSRCN